MSNLEKVMQQTSWPLLAWQKRWLLEQAKTTKEAEGLVCWLDAIQDAVIDDGLLAETTVFPDRSHSEDGHIQDAGPLDDP